MYELAKMGQDMIAVRPLTFSKVTTLMRGAGVGSTRTSIFRTNIEHTETGVLVSLLFLRKG
jgi:hypothetical protein